MIGTERYFYLTPSHYSLYQHLNPIINKYAGGKILDAGAGDMTYKFILEPKSTKYVPIDKYKTHTDIIIEDIEQLSFTNECFDTVFCSQVLEHIPHPWIAFQELSRIINKGGRLIITVPHLSYIHGEPEDFYRFTKYALSQLAAENNLHILHMRACGGIFSFIATPILTGIHIMASFVPFLDKLILLATKHISKAILLIDDKFDKNKIYALNYVAVFEKL